MKRYEYMAFGLNLNYLGTPDELAHLNRLGSEGWHIVSVVRDAVNGTVALLEREIQARKGKS